MSTARPPLALGFYRLGTGLLEPLAPRLLQRRARRGKEDPARLGERLGRAAAPRPEGPLVWLHGVSVGESLSLIPLVETLQARRPDLQLLVTSGTRTSAELLARRLPAGVTHQYAPVDGPAAVRRFLDHWRPGTGVFVESELWPNLILGAKAQGVRLALVSARMTEESARSWARSPAAAQALLGAYDLILPQDGATRARLEALGARPGPKLNLKLCGAPLACDEAELARLRAAAGARRIVLAASTHPGEEGLIADAFVRATSGAEPALLVVAPRHPDRGASVAAELGARGFAVSRRTAGEPLSDATTAYVADTLGEMGLFYRLADVVVMGGSFAPGVGGHNPLEPARLGAAILTGPGVANAQDVYDEMRTEVAVVEAADAKALARHIRGLLAHPIIARRIGEAALSYAERQGAALDEALVLLEPLLPQ